MFFAFISVHILSTFAYWTRLSVCVLIAEKRIVCRYCRYQKCLSVGMKPEGKYRTFCANHQQHLLSLLNSRYLINLRQHT